MQNQKRNPLIFITVLLLWTLLLYFFGSARNAFWGPLLMIASLFLRRFHNHHPLYLISLILIFIFLYTPVPDALKELGQSNITTIRTYKETIIAVSNPDTGQEVLPKKVRQALKMLISKEITSYQVSDEFRKSSENYQRLVEAAWPIKEDDESKHYIAFVDEIERMPSCELLDQIGGVALVYCDD